MTLGIGAGALIAGLFGMNVRLPDHVETPLKSFPAPK